MARSFNVLYRFLAKDSFSRVSKKIRDGNTKTTRSFRKLDAQTTKAGNSFKTTSRNFIGGFKGMAAAAIGFFSIRGFFEIGTRFQDSMADLSAITGATGDDLDKLKNKTLAMAKASVTSQADVAEAIKLVASAKPDLLKNIDALTATTEQVLLLKNAAGIELASAANITAQGLNIFGAAADQASRFVNVLAAGAKLGSSEIADTGEAMLLAGPAAKAAGLSFEQLNAAIQATAKGGIKGSRAGTALNAILGRLQRAGIDFQKLGLPGAFQLIKDKMDSLKDSTARAQFAAKIFGEEHAKVGFALLDNVSLLGEYEKTLAGTRIAQEQAATRLATFSTKFRRLGIIVKDAVIKTFLRLEPVLSKLVTRFGDFLEGIDEKKIAAFGDSLASIASVVGILASGFGIVFNVLTGIGQLIGEIAAAIVTLDFSKFSEGTKSFGQEYFGGAAIDAVKGFFGADTGAPIGQNNKSTTDINVNMTAPAGVIQSIESRTQGRASNVGVNMADG